MFIISSTEYPERCHCVRTLKYCNSKMSGERPIYEAWEQRIMSEEKGNRIIHFYLRSRSTPESSLLAAVGTEKSGRHYVYRVSKEFVETFGSSRTINAITKWKARVDVKNWLISVINDNLSPTKRDLDLVPNHQGSCSSRKRVKSLEKDLVMRIPKKQRSNRVRQGQNSSMSYTALESPRY